jgi:hypothetical protein
MAGSGDAAVMGAHDRARRTRGHLGLELDDRRDLAVRRLLRGRREASGRGWGGLSGLRRGQEQRERD